MTQNDALDKLRHTDVHARYVENRLMNEIDLTNETEETIISDDYQQLLDKLIEGLPPMQKKVFQLSRIEELSYKEIAELLHISVYTVQEHASIALCKIKKNLSQHTDILKMVKTLLMLPF
jgi:RNA polymerase sigma-70 factor (ECF subfamily)